MYTCSRWYPKIFWFVGLVYVQLIAQIMRKGFVRSCFEQDCGAALFLAAPAPWWLQVWNFGVHQRRAMGSTGGHGGQKGQKGHQPRGGGGWGSRRRDRWWWSKFKCSKSTSNKKTSQECEKKGEKQAALRILNDFVLELDPATIFQSSRFSSGSDPKFVVQILKNLSSKNLKEGYNKGKLQWSFLFSSFLVETFLKDMGPL